MNKNAKVWLTIACVAVLLAGAVFGTLAYFTDSESATNTFTVGEVGITLDESNESTPDADDRTTTGNAYHLLPGHSYVKDPTVTVEEGSSESYVRMVVKVVFADALTDSQLLTSLDNIFVNYDASVWPRAEKTVSADKKTITYEFRYKEIVDGEDAKLAPLFTGIQIPGEANHDQLKILNGMNIHVEAHAIQAAGFGTADLAWAAFAQQHPVS